MKRLNSKAVPVKKAMIEALRDYLVTLGQVAIAYSGGVDSTFLLALSVDVLGADKVVAMTIQSSLTPPWETAFAKDFCRARGIRHRIVDGSFILGDERVAANPPERCYYCKIKIIDCLRKEISGHGALLTGTNASDEGDVRPGMRAEEEMGVKTPLRRFRFSKEMIREHSMDAAIPGFDRPPAACFATRIPYGEQITMEKVRMIENAEAVMRQLGFTLVRARLIPPATASLEVAAEDIIRACDLLPQISCDLEAIGFTRVSVDLEGYRQGKLNFGHARAATKFATAKTGESR